MLKKIIKENIDIALDELNITIKKPYSIEVPKNKKFGDYSTNLALINAKFNKTNPMKLAQTISEKLNHKKIFKDVTFIKPGFINMDIANYVYHKALNNVFESGQEFAKSEFGNKKKVNIEFVSANPTGPLNIVSARAAAYGDTLHRIMFHIGYKPVREFYINDAGNQVDILAESIELRLKEIHGEDIGEFPIEAYHGEYVCEIAAQLNTTEGKKLNHLSENDRMKKIKNFGLKMLKDMQKESLDKFGVHFDSYISEKNLRKQGYVEEVLSYLSEANCTEEKDEAIWFTSSKFGDEKDRVLMKSDGSITYLVPDIAYHITKYHRKFDTMIDVLGPDHHGYVPRLRAAMTALKFDESKLEVVFLQQVNLFEDGEKIKMSKRAGKIITMDELIKDVGKDAARYFFIDRKPSAHLSFDLDLAKKRSNENPVFYIQYAHARISTLIKKAKKSKITLDKFDVKNNNKLKHLDELKLIRKMISLEEVLQKAAINREPHLLATYTLELASAFHKYYQKHPIIQTRYKKLSQARLYLIVSVRNVIKLCLSIMGISAPEKM
ncbi:MAG: arginine--tRNA ligase [Candidatus Cloacimonadota bacterium]|nr:arginine--tRNA ligase [Candidatus Cloacimonadota bacterium]